MQEEWSIVGDALRELKEIPRVRLLSRSASLCLWTIEKIQNISAHRLNLSMLLRVDDHIFNAFESICELK
jgi:hypothetical protein